MVLDGKSTQEHPVNAGVHKGFILGCAFFLLYINDFPDDVICNIGSYADDTTLYSNCDQASDLWQQLDLVAEPESDLRDTVDLGQEFVLFEWSNKTGAINMKMDGSFLEEIYFKMIYMRAK